MSAVLKYQKMLNLNRKKRKKS